MHVQTITVLNDGELRNYITVDLAAKKWGVKENTVHTWHKRRKIPGSFNIGNSRTAKGIILIPEDATKPEPRPKGRPRKIKQGE